MIWRFKVDQFLDVWVPGQGLVPVRLLPSRSNKKCIFYFL